jgi:hypothetical protein
MQTIEEKCPYIQNKNQLITKKKKNLFFDNISLETWKTVQVFDKCRGAFANITFNWYASAVKILISLLVQEIVGKFWRSSNKP